MKEFVLAAGCSDETRVLFENLVAAVAAGGMPAALSDPDGVLSDLYLETIQQTPDDLLHQLQGLAFIIRGLTNAGRLDEFRIQLLRTLAALGRRAQVELLTSGDR
jgi:hypothetical protein